MIQKWNELDSNMTQTPLRMIQSLVFLAKYYHYIDFYLHYMYNRNVMELFWKGLRL